MPSVFTIRRPIRFNEAAVRRPRIVGMNIAAVPTSCSFNEAAVRRPRIGINPRPVRTNIARFNEAAVRRPRIVKCTRGRQWGGRAGFNEAAVRRPRIAPREICYTLQNYLLQ